MHVSHFVIYEKNILITLRFVAKTTTTTTKYKKQQQHIILTYQPSLFYSSQEKHIYPVSLANSFQVRPKVQGPLFCHLDDQPVLNVISFQPSLTRLRTSWGPQCPTSFVFTDILSELKLSTCSRFRYQIYGKVVRVKYILQFIHYNKNIMCWFVNICHPHFDRILF